MVIFHRADRPLACDLQEVGKGEERPKSNILHPVGPAGTAV